MSISPTQAACPDVAAKFPTLQLLLGSTENLKLSTPLFLNSDGDNESSDSEKNEPNLSLNEPAGPGPLGSLRCQPEVNLPSLKVITATCDTVSIAGDSTVTSNSAPANSAGAVTVGAAAVNDAAAAEMTKSGLSHVWRSVFHTNLKSGDGDGGKQVSYYVEPRLRLVNGSSRNIIFRKLILEISIISVEHWY